MEKAISKMLTQLPPDNNSPSRGNTLQEPKDALGSEVSEKDLPPLPKQHKKGTTGPQPKGKGPSKHSRQLATAVPLPPMPSSDEEEDYQPDSLDILDEWRVEDSDSEQEGDWQDVPPSLHRESFKDDSFHYDTHDSFPSECDGLVLDTHGSPLFDLKDHQTASVF
ncbi:Hypothetical predicted protein [Pelobates cultripes]|uniref:Uncharacterized protein n=1 Tax=Pelobates cultripes TaxID=61616 RepID=A0AAD1SHG0_PELCU|nr:Hypothetical predicted protein [Pelobates cultripes]